MFKHETLQSLLTHVWTLVSLLAQSQDLLSGLAKFSLQHLLLAFQSNYMILQLLNSVVSISILPPRQTRMYVPQL